MLSVKRALRQFTFGTGKTVGRNSSGRITSFHRGGGAKLFQRTIYLKRNVVPSSVGVVERIEYDPNRSSSIALIRWIKRVCRRDMPEKALAQLSRKSLQIDNYAEGNNNSMLPPRSICVQSESLTLGLLRITVVALRASFFVPRARGEEKLQVQNWKKNNNVWMLRNKHKIAISWHSITR